MLRFGVGSRARGGATTPLDLRFIDLFMAVILALVFLALLLTVVTANVRPDAGEPGERVAELEEVNGGLVDENNDLRGRLEAAEEENRGLQSENAALKGQIEKLESSFSISWWLIWPAMVVSVAVIAALLLLVLEVNWVRLPWALTSLVAGAALIAGAGWLLHAVIPLADRFAGVITLPWWAFLLVAGAQIVPVFGMLLLFLAIASQWGNLRRGVVPRTIYEPREPGPRSR